MKRYPIYLLITLTFIELMVPLLVSGASFNSIENILNSYKKKLVVVEDLDQDAREFFINSEKGTNPGIVRADFNGDGIEDVAVLSKEGLKLFLRIFLCDKKCNEVKYVEAGPFDGIQYITPVKKGEIKHSVDGTSVKLKNTAIRLVDYGKASAIYYWVKQTNDFTSIATGD